MKTEKMEHFERFEDFCRALPMPGAFLVARDSNGKLNTMTIGWAMLGVVWAEPVMTVLVRPSRYTYGLMEKAKYFSVSVPVGKLKKELEYCGTHSGRDGDKIARCKLKASPGLTNGVSILEDCDLFYECEIVHKTGVIKENLDPGIIGKCYPKGDFHTVYSGRILHAYRKLS